MLAIPKVCGISSRLSPSVFSGFALKPKMRTSNNSYCKSNVKTVSFHTLLQQLMQPKIKKAVIEGNVIRIIHFSFLVLLWSFLLAHVWCCSVDSNINPSTCILCKSFDTFKFKAMEFNFLSHRKWNTVFYFNFKSTLSTFEY